MSTATPCPGCGEPRGGRYSHRGLAVCWPCWMKRTGLGPSAAPSPAPEATWNVFRRHLIDALWDEAMFGYVDQDRFIGSCPVCGTAVTVRFHGTAPRATLRCHGGCTEGEIAHRLGLVVRL